MSYESPNQNADQRQYVDRPAVVDHGPTVYEERTKPARTSLAAAFALAVAVAALVCALIVVLGPVGLVLGLAGIVLSIFGIRNGGRPGITGRGVGIAALVISLVAVLLGGAIVAGISTFLTNQNAVDRFEQQLDQWRDRLPDNVDVPTPN